MIRTACHNSSTLISSLGRRAGGTSIFTPAVSVPTLTITTIYSNSTTANNHYSFLPAAAFPFQGQGQVRTMATKKAGGSTSNGRDSAGRRLGVKLLHNEKAQAGSILVRQRGQKYRAGTNVGMGKDHTLFAKVAGKVQMEKIQLKHIGCTATGKSLTTIKRRKRTRTVLSILENMEVEEDDNDDDEVDDEAVEAAAQLFITQQHQQQLVSSLRLSRFNSKLFARK
mmetsp:Transcript_25923/g.27897  ORF Transcript_25923/g.27897 Transcript_25923/m.27897 type:complete len:225 (+) Transcript_25923:225-899(+)